MCVHRETGAQRAVKVLRKSHMDDDEKRMLFNEINILKGIVSANAAKDCGQQAKSDPSTKSSILANQKINASRTTPTLSRCTSSSKMTSATTSSLSKFLASTKICRFGCSL